MWAFFNWPRLTTRLFCGKLFGAVFGTITLRPFDKLRVCSKEVLLEHIEIRKMLAKRVDNMLADTSMPDPLRDYQREAAEKFRDFLLDETATKRCYLAHATGLGKTVWFSGIVRHCSGMRCLIIVPTKILVEQTARKVAKFTGGVIGHLSSLGKIPNDDGDLIAVYGHEFSEVVVSTDESFILHHAELRRDFDPHLIVWDECHWGYIKPAQIALNSFEKSVIVGTTATPDYLSNSAKGGSVPVIMDNGLTMYAPIDRIAKTHFQTCIDERSIRWGIESGWLAPLAWSRLQLDMPLDTLPIVNSAEGGQDYDQASLQAMMIQYWPVLTEAVCRLYEDPDYDLFNHQVFAICPSVKMAQSLADALASKGIPAACIHGGTSDTDRNIMLKAFKADDFKVLTSVMVLREGVDAQNADVCLMLRPTRSRVVYTQCIGRVLRPGTEDKYKVALVIDVQPRNPRMAPLSAPMLFAPPGSYVAERGILVGPKKGRKFRRGFKPRVVKSDTSEATETNTSLSPFLPDWVKPVLVHVEGIEIDYWAGEDGTFRADGDIWGHPTALAKIVPVSIPTITKRCVQATKEKTIRSRPGRDLRGAVIPFYALSEVEKLCEDLIATKKAGQPMWFEDEDGVWANKNSLRQLLRVGDDTADLLIAYDTVRRQLKKPSTGSPTWYYNINDMRKILRSGGAYA